MNDEIQKKVSFVVKEKGKYGIAIALIATMLFAIGFPGYVLVFLGVTGFFIWKAFAPVKINNVRGIFEFYLAANEMLRDDDKRWFGFEMHEVLHSGERILTEMPDPPPLMVFTLGALHHKMGNHETAAKYLTDVVECEEMDEGRRIAASALLKDYARVLRRIERDPTEAPQTSAAVRALERARRNRGATLLDESRKKLQAAKEAKELVGEAEENVLDLTTSIVDAEMWNDVEVVERRPEPTPIHAVFQEDRNAPVEQPVVETNGRKPISEVLKDIYGR